MENSMEIMTYAIVSETEADLAAKKISATSPIGKGLLGKSVGEIADIEVPNGIIHFEIIKIESL
jgi:transcription elongation factor GreA